MKTETKSQIVDLIKKSGSMRPAELTRVLKISPQALHRHLKQLIAKGKHRDEKSVFQERTQEKTGITPTYSLLTESGPDHSKLFVCAVFVGSEKVAVGEGNTKQKAEQDAARAALKAKGWK